MANCSDYISADDLKTGKQAVQHIEHVAKSKDANGAHALTVTDTIRGEQVTNLTLDGMEAQFQTAQDERETEFNNQMEDQSDTFQQFLLNSGYQFLGDYENGPYTITARNQIIRYQNEFWRLNAATNPPFATTGVNSTSWGADVTHLVSVGDATLRQDIADDSGAGLVGWKRSALSSAINTAAEALNGISISIWEYADYVTARTDPNDPRTGDWSTALSMALDAVISQVAISIQGNARMSSGVLVIPPGKYRIDDTVSKDLSTYSYVTGKPNIKIVGHGAYLSANFSQKYVLDLKGSNTTQVTGISFTKESSSQYPYGLKLGDTATANSKAMGGRFTELYFYGYMKAITCGQVYDIIFDMIYATQFVVVSDSDTANPATGLHLLTNISNNHNNIRASRLHFETSNTSNYVPLKFEQAGVSSSVNHNILIQASHIEPGRRGVKWFDIADGAGIHFDTVVFSDNGSNVISPATYNNGVINSNIAKFTNCRFQTNNKSSSAYDPLTHKSMLKIGGTGSARVFDTCYFDTAFSGVTGNTTWDVVFDTSAASQGRFAVSTPNSCINDFGRKFELYSLYCNPSAVNRKYITGVHTDGRLAIFFNNTDRNYSVSLPFIEFGPDAVNAGAILYSSGGPLTLNPNSGASSVIIGGNTRPDAAATRNNGSASFPWNNIYSQNAVTVVSDENLKPVKSTLSDSEMSTAKACSLLFIKYKLAAAIAEKGDSARYHFGVIAQDIIKAFESEGLSADEYGVVVSDTINQRITSDEYGYKPIADENGEINIPPGEDGTIHLIDNMDTITTGENNEMILRRTTHLIRYEELLCFINAGMIQRLEKLESALGL